MKADKTSYKPMKYYLLFFLFMLITLNAPAQDKWTAFWNSDTTLIGFKDANGTIKIPPKFHGFTTASQFDDIIGVTESTDDTFYNYYITKSGRVVGRDSLFIFDNSADCEHEGFIRFYDKATDNTGMFNRYGEVVIPATYSGLSKTRNGMIVALKGATKKWEDEEHPTWEGGEIILIDTCNQLLVRDFKREDHINFYSAEITPYPHPDSIRQSFKGENGQYYSFVDYEKEFRAWLTSWLSKELTKEQLLNVAYKEITYWDEDKGWIGELKGSYIGKHFQELKRTLLFVTDRYYEHDIFQEGLNQFIYINNDYSQYFDNCRQAKDWKYPVMSLIIHTNTESSHPQAAFDFLRTAEGYKLISVSLR